MHHHIHGLNYLTISCCRHKATNDLAFDRNTEKGKILAYLNRNLTMHI
jgi:hypothetical protein